MYGCGFLILEQTGHIIQKRRKATLLLAAVGGLQTGFAAGQG